jgi:hypothetical protein
VEVTFVPPTNITSGSKKKVVRFPAFFLIQDSAA